MERVFSFFSNTVEEFEAFIKAGTFYWPRALAKKTKYQQKGNEYEQMEENIGDAVYIVVGTKVKNDIKDPILKGKITGAPMITHKGIIKEVYNRPVMGYRYTHGRNTMDKSFMLPFEFLKEMKQLDTYMGKEFSTENKIELEQAIEMGKIIKRLLDHDEIHFQRAFIKKGTIFIKNDNSESVFRLDNMLVDLSYKEAGVSERLTYREMPSKKSVHKIVEECNKAGLNGKKLIENLRTWRAKEFVKVEIEEEIFQELDGKLQEGVSTRLIEKEDNSDSLLTDIKKKIGFDFNSAENQKDVVHMNLPKNQILYGPPGTGKTYSVVRKALEIVDPELHQQLIGKNADRKEWMGAYQQYTEEKQIQFCTFHQSYSYEDFVEGLRSDAEGNFRPTNGIFLDICKEAMDSNKIINPAYEFDEEETNFYKMSLGKKDLDTDIYKYCIENKLVSIGFGDNLNFSKCNTKDDIKELVEKDYKGKDKKSTVLNNINRFKHSVEIGDIVVISYGNSYIRAVGRITGEYEYKENTGIRYHHFRSVEWLYKGKLVPVEEILINGEFTMQSLYNIRKENLNLEALQELISTVEIAQETKMKNYVLIMDEINRGNISRVFGELITLIEDDKRIGRENEIFVKLPYSRKKFGVPSNLYLIGTMNTADRSITLMDTALRRRFEFIEMVPNISLLPEDIDGINVKKLVHTINQRIEFLYDRDHTIGHAIFLCDDLSERELINIIKKKVIPLLQEYFYDDWEKIEMILGGAASDDSSCYFLKKEKIKPADIFTVLNNHYLEEQVKYSIVPQPNKQALMNIYKGQNS
ncbi:hypothetical protein CON42_11955 [Bacillus thuringiensis]|uniref:AAA family ATPase n=1 Tax=Bacillus cereus group TaxID=86661 RepID=UPI0007FB392D|nr:MULTISPECIES: AAA family ATPase [Bacillus cereus group]MCP1399477.1 5-methylcytosine-specific restriction endonuclease McrBC GTP-binding regulatory subunit McrB [Bacillus cereus]OBW84725.1 hypothetical protein A9L49_27715 [Bacillus cereus]OBW85198.1 hypothetical protein A9L49_27530 [Bacillus cereus]PEA15251.1 hypothetical protein CON42_11955 [Bacillus thuringiensis]PER53189.1 hypothetical protein CN486_23205 [Bacillus thuringiensis]